MATGLPVEAASGKPPGEILENALELARELADRHARCFSEQLLPALTDEGIEILRWKELVPDEQTRLERLFKERIYPVLTPLVGRPGTPVPVHLRPDPQPGGDDRRSGDRPDDLRPGEGTAAAAAVPGRAPTGSCRWKTSSPRT